MNTPRKAAFILAATEQGTMIVNRFDYRELAGHETFGLGWSVLNESRFKSHEGPIVTALAEARKKEFGDGVMVVDCGANIGIHTIPWAISMTDWGCVIAIEAQERLFYALCGNIALNNCQNAWAVHAAVSEASGMLDIPKLDYTAPASFGSLELLPVDGYEYIGQEVDYFDASKMTPVRVVTIDSMHLDRLDILKIDVERMELAVLRGAAETITRCRPILVVEHIKLEKAVLNATLATLGYPEPLPLGMNTLAFYPGDPTRKRVTTV